MKACVAIETVISSQAMGQRKSRLVDKEMSTDSILEYFKAIPDPRIERSRLHPLESVLTLALIAVICGADSFVGIEEFGLGKEAWLKTFLHLPHGIPSHDTIGRIFALLDPQGGRIKITRFHDGEPSPSIRCCAPPLPASRQCRV